MSQSSSSFGNSLVNASQAHYNMGNLRMKALGEKLSLQGQQGSLEPEKNLAQSFAQSNQKRKSKGAALVEGLAAGLTYGLNARERKKKEALIQGATRDIEGLEQMFAETQEQLQHYQKKQHQMTQLEQPAIHYNLLLSQGATQEQAHIAVQNIVREMQQSGMGMGDKTLIGPDPNDPKTILFKDAQGVLFPVNTRLFLSPQAMEQHPELDPYKQATNLNKIREQEANIAHVQAQTSFLQTKGDHYGEPKPLTEQQALKRRENDFKIIRAFENKKKISHEMMENIATLKGIASQYPQVFASLRFVQNPDDSGKFFEDRLLRKFTSKEEQQAADMALKSFTALSNQAVKNMAAVTKPMNKYIERRVAQGMAHQGKVPEVAYTLLDRMERDITHDMESSQKITQEELNDKALYTLFFQEHAQEQPSPQNAATPQEPQNTSQEPNHNSPKSQGRIRMKGPDGEVVNVFPDMVEEAKKEGCVPL